MKNTEHMINDITRILHTLPPGALRRVLAYAERERRRQTERNACGVATPFVEED